MEGRNTRTHLFKATADTLLSDSRIVLIWSLCFHAVMMFACSLESFYLTAECRSISHHGMELLLCWFKSHASYQWKLIDSWRLSYCCLPICVVTLELAAQVVISSFSVRLFRCRALPFFFPFCSRPSSGMRKRRFHPISNARAICLVLIHHCGVLCMSNFVYLIMCLKRRRW